MAEYCIALDALAPTAERRMIMRKNTKETIKSAIQFCLLASSSIFGFVFGYSFIWFLVGLPQTAWALMVTTLMGILSAGGLFTWICKKKPAE